MDNHFFSETAALTRRSLRHILRSPDTIITTAVMPIHEHADAYRLDIDGLEVDVKFIEHTWDMDLAAGGTMKHSARRSVRIS